MKNYTKLCKGQCVKYHKIVGEQGKNKKHIKQNERHQKANNANTHVENYSCRKCMRALWSRTFIVSCILGTLQSTERAI